MRRGPRARGILLGAAPLGAVLLLAGIANAAGQGSPARMAGAYSLSARGAEAPSWNPATLAWNDSLHVHVLSVGGFYENNSFDLGDYARWNGGTWDDGAKREILSRIPADGLEGHAGARVILPGVARRGWAVTLESRGAGRGKAPRDLARLALFGNTPEESFLLDGSEGLGIAYSELRLTHARPLLFKEGWEVSGGVSLKYLQGWAYGEVTRAEGEVVTTFDHLHGAGLFEERTALGGLGLGLDAGLAARSLTGWSAGLSVRNLAAAIRWFRDTRLHRQTVEADSLNLDELEDDADLLVADESSQPIPAFTDVLPAVITAAVSRRFGDVYLEADLSQGVLAGPETSTTPRLAVGASYPVSRVVHANGGLAVGGLDGPVLAVGSRFALRRLDVLLGIHSAGALIPFSGRGLGFELSVGVR